MLNYSFHASLQEENGGGVTEILLNVLEILPVLNRRHLGFEDVVKMNCTRCKMDTEYPPQPSFGIFIVANSLREFKACSSSSFFLTFYITF